MLYYDNEVYQFMRRFAVTDFDELIVGETYYSNSYPAKFVLKGLLTNAEAYAKRGINWEDAETANDIAWYETNMGGDYSLSDSGVTDRPYNPWLIFRNEVERDACETLLKIEFENTRDGED